MDQRIIYPLPGGGVAVIVPAPGLTAVEVAAKDVPPNTPYKLVHVSEIPSDRTFRDAWEYTP